NVAICVFGLAAKESAGMLSIAVLASRRCSAGDAGCVSAADDAAGGCAGGVCALVTAGATSTAVAAIAVVHREIELFIGWLLLILIGC
ncbi:MAG: hypothetical protein LC753_05970, partial [Acidobacteria bacterium]|nr:hypothetical protein [Acidobacteriota bacterium]MCA1649837.1 hypothetical protein [Acidobacteriota bacterium]